MGKRREENTQKKADQCRKVEFEKELLEPRRKGEKGDLAYRRKGRKEERRWVKVRVR